MYHDYDYLDSLTMKELQQREKDGWKLFQVMRVVRRGDVTSQWDSAGRIRPPMPEEDLWTVVMRYSHE